MMVVGYLVLLLSLVGVVMAHIGTEDVPVVFGTMSGSLSLLVFVASLFFVKKMGSCCPCQCELPKKKEANHGFRRRAV